MAVRARSRALVVVEDTENVRAGKDRSELEGGLGRVTAGAELASVKCGLRLDLEEVSPFLLVGGDAVVHAAGASPELGRGGDEEAAAGKTHRSTSETGTPRRTLAGGGEDSGTISPVYHR
jgi:hypothetical protein